MQHVALTHADFRKVIKDWVMKQPPERKQSYHDHLTCIVGQFLSENPEFRSAEYGRIDTYSMDGPPNVWNSSHSARCTDEYGRTITASEALSAGHTVSRSFSDFGQVQTAMSQHPLWRDL
jgi:hypothetical protein